MHEFSDSHARFAILESNTFTPASDDLPESKVYGLSELLEWRRAPRAVDEPVEVSWAVHGHPTAKWEAVIMEVGSRPGRVDHDGQVRVRYTGFERSWDEWIGVRSTRINPRRSHAALRLCDFVAHPTSHTK